MEYVIWVGIDPNLLLAGLDTKALFGCDNYLRFNVDEPKCNDLEVKEEVSSGEEDNHELNELDPYEQDDGEVSEKESSETLSQPQGTAAGKNLASSGNSKANITKKTRDHSKKNSDLECEKCQKQFCTKLGFRRHQRRERCSKKKEGGEIQPSLRPTMCPECGKMLGSVSHMKKHVKAVHWKEKNYQCDQCDQAFATRSGLTRHTETRHQDGVHMCEFCMRTFTAQAYVTDHVRREHSESTVQCPTCNKKFIKQVNLDLHIENEICEGTRQAAMKIKKKMKIREDRHPCPHCKAMMTRKALKRHIVQVHMTGTGISPKGKSQRCMHCEFHTPFEKKLQKHLDVMHPKMYNPYHESQ
jgi:hypothetical protein